MEQALLLLLEYEGTRGHTNMLAMYVPGRQPALCAIRIHLIDRHLEGALPVAEDIAKKMEREKALRGPDGRTCIRGRWKRPMLWALAVAVLIHPIAWASDNGWLLDKHYNRMFDGGLFLAIILGVVAWMTPYMLHTTDDPDQGYPERGLPFYVVLSVLTLQVVPLSAALIAPLYLQPRGEVGSLVNSGVAGAPLAAFGTLCAVFGATCLSFAFFLPLALTFSGVFAKLALALSWIVTLIPGSSLTVFLWQNTCTPTLVVFSVVLALVGAAILVVVGVIRALIPSKVSKTEEQEFMLRRLILERTGKTFPQYPGQQPPQWALEELGMQPASNQNQTVHGTQNTHGQHSGYGIQSGYEHRAGTQDQQGADPQLPPWAHPDLRNRPRSGNGTSQGNDWH